MTTLRRGEMLFNDARMCFQNWLSCASCHPGGRTDGLNWDLMNDGLGNPKSGKSLVWAHKTPPSMITGRIMSREQPTIRTGVDANAKATVRSHIQFVQFAVREEEDVVAICEYLESIKPAPSPVLVGGKLSPAALRGRKVFKTAGCASCHSGALFTDQKKHFVGTAIGLDAKNRTEYDTPTLVEVWRTAPYLSQGQAATILDVLSKEHNPNDHHGKTSNLSKQELADLAEYVMSL
jgi:hypothetical protein